MKSIFLIEDNLENRISYWHILFFLVCLPFDRFYSEIVLISFSVHILLHFNKCQLRDLLNKRVLILQSVFILTIFGTFYSSNRQQAVEDITKQLSVFIFPLLFSLTKMNIKKYQWQLLFLFSLVCTFTIFYLYLDAVHTIYYYRLPFFSLLSPAFENHNFSQPIDLHATYFSMYVALSFLFMLQQLIRERENRLGLFLCCIILGAGLIQLSSRAVFFAMFIILNGVFPFVFFTGKQRLKYMMVSLLCCGLVIVLIFSIGTFRERYFKDVRMDLSNTRSEETISDPRLERWKAAWKIIRQSPVTGHGSGSEITLLKDRYFSEKMYSSYLNELNAHNQYLSWLIKAGCLGLLVYLYTLFTGLQQAVAGKNALFLSFLILIIIVSVSENILDVNKGIFFYSFFFSFFSLEEPVTFRE